MRFTSLLSFAALFISISAAPFSQRSSPIPPSEDPFYTPAAGYESFPIGAILNSRQITNLFGTLIIPDKIKGAYQLLVRSEDSFGNPNAIVTTVFVPIGGDPNKLLSYQVAEDSASFQNCQPSYAMQLGAQVQSGGIGSAPFEEILIQAGINQGWYVVVPDYE